MLRTPLYDEHHALGATFTDFGGWEMPVRYGSDLDEHHAVRNSAGLFDISHMSEFSVVGDDAAKFLDYAFVTEVSKLNPGKAKYSILCNENGKSIDDVIIYRLAEVDYLVIANAANRAAVAKALNDRAGGFAVQVIDNSDETALVALQGPKSAAILQKVTNIQIEPLKYYSIASAEVAGLTALIARTGYTGEDGFEILVHSNDAVKLWRELIKAGGEALTPCGLAARDTLRLEAGMPLYGHELTAETTPFSANLGRSVHLDRGDFVGKAALVKPHTGPKLYGLIGEGKRAARAGYSVFMPGGTEPIGEITSGVLSPTLGYPIGFAYLSAELETGSKLEADVRGTRVGYEVVNLPFYRRQNG
jgi:aminomethyltransferase